MPSWCAGFNEDEVEAFAAFARERGVIMRFIEFMPLDADRHWSRELMVPAAEVYSAHPRAMAAGADSPTKKARPPGNTALRMAPPAKLA